MCTSSIALSNHLRNYISSFRSEQLGFWVTSVMAYSYCALSVCIFTGTFSLSSLIITTSLIFPLIEGRLLYSDLGRTGDNSQVARWCYHKTAAHSVLDIGFYSEVPPKKICYGFLMKG